ncbi:hypothetical protein CAP36_12770 [Chitinophagaceae bacterium IBVUCB2]|nr:hypothetical protein CAP36_12770 [Chitinophagaceae bacterium IBVUCB2]
MSGKITPLSSPPVQIKRKSSLKILKRKCEANVNKTAHKNLLVNNKPLPLPSALKKRKQFFSKQVDFHSKRF